MSKAIDTITVDVKANLTVDDDTANTILNLLELYCRQKNLKIEYYHAQAYDEKEPVICFEFKDDKEKAGVQNVR